MNSKLFAAILFLLAISICAHAQEVFTKEYIKKNSVKNIIRTKYYFKNKKGVYEQKRVLNYTMSFDKNGNKVFDDTLTNTTIKNTFNEQGLLVESQFKAISWGEKKQPSMFKYNSATHSYDDSKNYFNSSERNVLKIKTEFEYDTHQLLKKRVDEYETEEYFYNKDNRLSCIITTDNKTKKADTTVIITYNDKGLKSKETIPGESSKLFYYYYYDERNRLVNELDSMILPFADNFQWVQFGYDDKDRLVSRITSDHESKKWKNSEFWVYDKNDRLTFHYTTSNYYSVENIYKLEAYTYDEKGLLINFKSIENLEVKAPELADKNKYYGGRPLEEYDYKYEFQ